jgi:hypothetical protein
MRNSAARACALVVVTLGAAACHADNLGVHSCPTEYSGGWGNYGLSLEHVEPAGCPVYIPALGTWRETGAVVDDGGLREFSYSYLFVQDANHVTLNSIQREFKTDPEGRWTSEVFVGYPAGRVALRPDRAAYDLFFRSGGAGPTADMTITYNDRVISAIRGPGTAASGSTVTWEADVSAGEPPFTYRWYKDWKLVGNQSSFSTEIGGSGWTELRLDVVDSRGEAASRLKKVWVSGCGKALSC